MWLVLYGRFHDSDRMSHQCSITTIKEGNDGMVDITINDSISERQGSIIDGVFSIDMSDSVIIMHSSES